MIGVGRDIVAKEDLLSDLKDVQFFMDQITSDQLDGVYQSFFNKAKNKLMDIIADGEKRLTEKLRASQGQLSNCPNPKSCGTVGCMGICGEQ